MKKHLAFLLFSFFALSSYAQNQGAYTWKTLSKLTFASKFNDQTGDVVYAPIYSSEVKTLVGKEVELKGYIIPVPSRDGTFILSAFPYSSCYFCGGAGPETVIEVHPRIPILSRSNKPVILKGKLALNEPYDMLLLPYFLKDATLVSE